MPNHTIPHQIHHALGGSKFTQATGCSLAHITLKGVLYKLPVPLINNATHVGIDQATQEHFNFYLLRQELAPMLPLRTYKHLHLHELAGIFHQLISLPLNRPEPIE